MKPHDTLKHSVLASALLLATAAQGNNTTISVSAEQRQSLALTLYSENIAQVSETRQLPILQAGQAVQIEDVSAQLQPQTLQLTNAGRVSEQNYNDDLISYQRLLQHYIGQKVQLAEQNPATGAETIETVRLLATEGSHALIERASNVESLTLNSTRRFIFPSHPAQLTLKPSIGFRSQGTEQAQAIGISYLTSGLSWQTDYVINLNEEGNRASLKGMATLRNETGTSFPGASIKLLAGSVNQPVNTVQRYAKAERMLMAADASGGSAPAREQLQAFHLYKLDGKIDLLNNQQKQLPLLNSDSLTVEQIQQLDLYVSAHPQGQRQQIRPRVMLQFENSSANGLGIPMPSGAIRVFSPDSSGALQYTGGSNIGNQPRDARVSLQLGQSFDLTANQYQTAFEKTYDGALVNQRVVLKNTAEKTATVELNSRFQKRWNIEQSSHPYEARGNAAYWQLNVPANSELELTFQVRLFNK